MTNITSKPPRKNDINRIIAFMNANLASGMSLAEAAKAAEKSNKDGEPTPAIAKN